MMRLTRILFSLALVGVVATPALGSLPSDVQARMLAQVDEVDQGGEEYIEELQEAHDELTPILDTIPEAVDHGATDADGHGAGHGEEHGGGGLLSVNTGLTIWTLITFLLLMILLGKFAWPPLMASLVQRENHIREAVEGAERAQQEAAAVLARYRGQLEQAKQEAQSIIDEGRKDAEAVKESILQEGREEADRIRERTNREIQLAHDKALQELHDEVVFLSTNIAGKVIGRQLDASQHRQLIDEFIDEYSKSAN